jgi:AcrR family transcriptional regulator
MASPGPARTTAPATRAESQARTRQLVLEAAERLFQANGFAATSLEDIAKAAGFSKGAVYSNFAGKTDLFFAIVEQQFAVLTDHLRSVLAGGADLPAQLAAVAAVYEHYVRVETGWARWFPDLAALAGQDPEARHRFAAVVQGMERAIADVIAEQQQSLGLAAALPPEDAAALVVALVVGLTVRTLQDLDSPPELFAAGLARLLAG